MKISIELCYNHGNLAGALRDAARFVETILPETVWSIYARQDDTGAWWVDVIYYDDLPATTAPQGVDE